MNSAPLPLRTCLCGGLILLAAAAACRGDDSAGQRAATFDIIQFTPPAGWTSKEAPQARVFAAPDSTAAEQAMILMVLAPPQEGLDLRAAFEAAMKEVTSGGKLLQSG